MLLAGLVLVLALAWGVNAFAEEAVAGKPNTFFPDFFTTVGTMIYNLLPWNWGSWVGPN
jgi:hypothetical protein